MSSDDSASSLSSCCSDGSASWHPDDADDDLGAVEEDAEAEEEGEEEEEGEPSLEPVEPPAASRRSAARPERYEPTEQPEDDYPAPGTWSGHERWEGLVGRGGKTCAQLHRFVSRRLLPKADDDLAWALARSVTTSMACVLFAARMRSIWKESGMCWTIAPEREGEGRLYRIGRDAHVQGLWRLRADCADGYGAPLQWELRSVLPEDDATEAGSADKRTWTLALASPGPLGPVIMDCAWDDVSECAAWAAGEGGPMRLDARQGLMAACHRMASFGADEDEEEKDADYPVVQWAGAHWRVWRSGVLGLAEMGIFVGG